MAKKERIIDNENIVRISVYLSRDLLKEINEYYKKRGYGNRSEMFRMAFRTLKQVFPIHTTKEDISLEDHLINIEKRLEEITLKQKLLQKEESLLDTQEEQLNFDIENLQTEATEINRADIPNFEEIEKKIMDLLYEIPKNKIKDFVLMNHFRGQYSDGIIWAVLLHLRNMKKLKLEKGMWKLYNATR